MLSHSPRTPLLIVLSGPSGVGKDAILNSMRILEMPLHFTVTATTRPIRANEHDGVDYHFISEETFRRMLDEGNFLEHAQVYGNWYGVPKPQVRNAMASGNDVVVKIDVQGAATIKRLAPQAVMIFVVPPSIHELERRLKWRMTESDESLRRRVEESRSEMEHIGAFDYVVTNDALDEAVHQMNCIITAERCRMPHRVVRLD